MQRANRRGRSAAAPVKVNVDSGSSLLQALRWVWANAAAWAAGMPLVFVGMDFVPWESGTLAVVAGVRCVCGITGLAAGAIHGRVLITLTRDEDAGLNRSQ